MFANLSDAEVDQFADELKKHFRFSGVMAMLTEHNRNWYFIDFFDEVMKDHRLFKAIDELREEMKNCESADPSKVENLKKLNDTLMEAFLYLKAQDYEEKRLLALSSELRRLRELQFKLSAKAKSVIIKKLIRKRGDRYGCVSTRAIAN